MIDVASLLSSLVDSTVKVLPAVLAAYFAYRLWYLKLVQDRADSITKGCAILRHFCVSLDRHLIDDPDKPNAVAITSINANVESILATQSISSRFGSVLDTYHLWCRKVYFPLSKDNEMDVRKRRSDLLDCITACDQVIAAIRNSTPKQLARLKLASL